MLGAGNMIKTLMMLAYLAAEPASNATSPELFTVYSPAFPPNHYIPALYTCDGNNISIPVKWSGVPRGTQSFALVLFDEDTPWPGFYHWEVYDIPRKVRGLPLNLVATSPEQVGNNSWGHKKYEGPCPTTGTHHYVIRLYALNTKLKSSAGESPLTLHRAMNNHIIDWTQTTGLYRKS